jgi:SAM-dependent methyltransferase
VENLFDKILNQAERSLPWVFAYASIYRQTPETVHALLDVGCGRGNVTQSLIKFGLKLREAYLVGVDIWLPYLAEAKKVYHDVVQCDVRKLPFRSSSFDVVIATDVIEHVEKTEGYALVEAVENLAVGQVFLYTPVGYMAKKNLEDKNPWQAHKSGWRADEFRKRGYKVRGLDGARFLYGERAQYKLKSKSLRPIMVILRIFSSFFTFVFVDSSYRMVCVRNSK